MKRIAEKGIDVISGRSQLSKKLFYILSASLVVSFVLYAYFLAAITINTAEAKKFDSNIKELMSDIATLEVDYLESVNKIDMEYARSLGFKEVDTISFVQSGDETTSVAFAQ